MRCEEVAAQLQAYLDGELAPQVRDDLSAHLRACPRCAAEARKYDRLFRLLASQPMISPSHDLVGRVMGNVRAAHRASLSWMLTKIAAAAACVLLAVFIGYRSMHHVQDVPATSSVVGTTPLDPGAALAALWDSVAGPFRGMPDYAQNVVGGIEWLTLPITSYVNEELLPRAEETLWG